ncbi:hypothetical protein [Niallia sp.]|uniref:hypothetical protein n=1 Tax=Niallia sp. TaxID=2837523 RepID=UPI002899BEB5|nr:hypothetical protein [Niallia sp.]
MLTFQEVDEMLQSIGLKSHPIKDGKCFEYEFPHWMLGKKRYVATQVTLLKNDGVGDYIDHLQEYDNHPDKIKMGQYALRHLKNRDELKKVTIHYK